jgi:hypothetical protein
MLTGIWLTLKQHRFETIAVTVLCLGAAIGAFIEAFRLNSLNFPSSCLSDGRVISWFDPSATATACQLASQKFNAIANGLDMGLVRSPLYVLPFFVGIAFGAQLVAKEIEQGTAPLSWALAGSRRRWLLGKLLAAIVLTVPLLLIAGLAADVLQGALVPGTDPHASFDNYLVRGVPVVFWGLAALAATVALGTFLGRTMPALLVALVVCFVARGLWESTLNGTVLHPLAVLELPGVYTPGELLVYQSSGLYLDGKPWEGDLDAWWQAHSACTEVTPSTTACGPIDMNPGPQPAWFVIHGDQYWPIVALESVIPLLGSLFCGAVALVWVDRRRPY